MSDGTSNPARYFGQQVRRARRAAGWTLAEFGQRIGYDPGQISRIENGKRPPTDRAVRPERMAVEPGNRRDPGRPGPPRVQDRLPPGPLGKTVKNRMHFDVITTDFDAETDRLIGLGATKLNEVNGATAHWVTLADPEGNEFDLIAG